MSASTRSSWRDITSRCLILSTGSLGLLLISPLIGDACEIDFFISSVTIADNTAGGLHGWINPLSNYSVYSTDPLRIIEVRGYTTLRFLNLQGPYDNVSPILPPYATENSVEKTESL